MKTSLCDENKTRGVFSDLDYTVLFDHTLLISYCLIGILTAVIDCLQLALTKLRMLLWYVGAN